MDLIGYLAGGLCIVCLIALAVPGGRAVRLAVAALVLVAVGGFVLFALWAYLYGRD